MNGLVKTLFPYLIIALIVAFNIITQGQTSSIQLNDRHFDTQLPASFYNLEGLPPVEDQVVAGSCYAWAAAYYYLTHLQWREYGWDVNDPEHQCSPAFVYNLTNGGVDNGAWEGDSARHDAFELFETLGCATMVDMPYSYSEYQAFPSETAFLNGMKFRTLSTQYISTRTDSGLQVLKDHLFSGDLATLGIYGYQNFVSINNYNNIYTVSELSGGRLFWHEVTIIGYDDDKVTADGSGAFYLVNSFGTGWVENGFFWMSYEAVKHTQTSCGYAMYAEDRIGYEPNLTARFEVQHADRYHLVYQAGIGNSSAPDTLLTFFDFSPMSLYTGLPYPESAFVLDISDLIPFIEPGADNEIFIRIIDEAPGNSLTGNINSLVIGDVTLSLSANLSGIPSNIVDENLGAEQVIDLNYSLSPPQNVNSQLNTENGFVQLSWDQPAQPAGLIEYHVYLNGRLLDVVQSTAYNYFLSLRGIAHYGISALYSNGESMSASGDIEWIGPEPFGVPFTDSFENGFGGWYQVGSSGIPCIITNDYVYEGQYSVGIKTFPTDYTALARLFDTMEGADVESWFLMNSFPVSLGGGGSILFTENNLLFGSFFDSLGHPNYIYTNNQYQSIPVLLDSSISIDSATWYKQKLWYYNGKFQIMLIDEGWNVILNRVANFIDQNISLVALYAEGLNGGWNYFDKFSVKQWSPDNLLYFEPVNPTNNPYAIIINEASIDSSLLEEGDEIAFFDGNVCVGAVEVDGEWPLEINVWEADSINPGFISGNPITAHIWSNQINIIYDTEITFEIGDGTFGDGIFSRLSIEGSDVLSSPAEKNIPPGKFSLMQNYPNPFNPSTAIEYNIPENCFVTIKIYDVLGNEVKTLVNEEKPAGKYAITFNANGLSSGVYFYKLQTDKLIETKKMLYLK